MGRRSTKGSKSNKQELPSYTEMIETAIRELKEKSGSTKSEILKYINGNWDIDSGAEKKIESELRKCVEDGKLIQSTKGKSKVRLFKLKQQKDKKQVNVTKLNKEKKTKKTVKFADDSESSKPDTMTRAKLPTKVKEAKERKRAAALAKREAAKKARTERKKEKRRIAQANKPSRTTARMSEGAINAKIFAAFEEIWRTQL